MKYLKHGLLIGLAILHATRPAEASADRANNDALAAKGALLIADESPESYQKAGARYFIPALRKNPDSLRLWGLVVSSYLRRVNMLGHSDEDFAVIRSALKAPPKSDAVPVEYVAALAEYLLLVQRPDEAAALLDSVLEKRLDAELFHQRARAALALGNADEAKKFAARGLGPEDAGPANPRHLLFFYERCEGAEAEAALERLGREFPLYQPYRLARARQLVKLGQDEEAVKFLEKLAAESSLSPKLASEAKLLQGEAELNLGHPEKAAALSRGSEDPLFLDLHVRALAAQPATAEIYEHVARGWKAELAGSYELAINSYVAAAELNRNDPFPFQRLAEMHRRLGAPDLAMKRDLKAWSTPARPLSSALAIAAGHLRRFELKEASSVLAACRAREKENAACQFLFGRLAELRHDEAAATRYFKAALRGQRRAGELYVHLGKIAAEKSDDELAEFYFALALEQDPRDELASLGLALSRFQLSGPASAQAFLQRQLSLDPRSPALLTNSALLHLRSGDQLAGKNALQNAIRADSRYSRAFFLLGELTKEEGDRQTDYSAKRHSYRYALASFEMYSKLAPGDADGYLATAQLYFDIRDLGAAAKNFYQVLELVPQQPGPRLRLAQIARNGGDLRRAEELLKEELRVNPYSDASLIELGNMAMARKDFSDAEKRFSAAFRLNPKNADAQFGLGVVHHLNGAYAKALKSFEIVARLDPLKADVFWQIGLVEQKRNRWDNAAKAFYSYVSLVSEEAARNRALEKIKQINQHRDPIVVAVENATNKIVMQREMRPDQSVFERLAHASMALQMRGFENSGETAAMSVSAFGKKTVVNRFVEFQVPASFQCSLANDTFLCQSGDSQRRRDAFITVVAQNAVAGLDEIAVYKAHLEKPRSFESLSGEQLVSEPKYSRQRELFGHPWVEAIHVNSELPDFVTRYFATRSGELGVLIGISVRRDKYQENFREFEAVADSVKVFGSQYALQVPTPITSFGTAAVQTLQEKKATEFLPALARGGKTSLASIEESYQALLRSFEQRAFTEMLKHANTVLRDRNDYKDAVLYQTIAYRGIAAQAEQAQRQEQERNWANLKKEVAELEEQGRKLNANPEKNLQAIQKLESVKQELYRRDPMNRSPASWGKQVEEK